MGTSGGSTRLAVSRRSIDNLKGINGKNNWINKCQRGINEMMYTSLMTNERSDVCTLFRSILQSRVCRVEAHTVVFATWNRSREVLIDCGIAWDSGLYSGLGRDIKELTDMMI